VVNCMKLNKITTQNNIKKRKDSNNLLTISR
jgi:hypothetical protein